MRGLVTWIAFLPWLLLATPGCSGKKDGAVDEQAFHQIVLARFTLAGLAPGPFEETDPKRYGAKSCRRGEVSELHVLICRYGSEEAAREARTRMLRAFVGGAVTGAVRSRGQVAIAVADRKKVDLRGKHINRLLQSFHPTKPPGDAPAPREGEDEEAVRKASPVR